MKEIDFYSSLISGEERTPFATLIQVSKDELYLQVRDTTFTRAIPDLNSQGGYRFFNQEDNAPWFIRDLLPDAWGKAVFTHEMIKIGRKRELDLFHQIAFIGHSSIMQFRPVIDQSDDGHVYSLADLSRQARDLQNDPHVKQQYNWMRGSISLGGARPKFYIDLKDGEADYSQAPSSRQWIAKLQGRQDPPYAGNEEYLYYLLADACGIKMETSHLIKGHFVTKRFDQNHYVRTFASLNHAEHRNAQENSYDRAIELCFELGCPPGDAQKILELAIFNTVIGNNDDHGKNISFRMDAGRNWSLAPFYDLTAESAYGGRAMHVNGTAYPELEDFYTLAEFAGLSHSIVDHFIEKIGNKIQSVAPFILQSNLSDHQERILSDLDEGVAGLAR